MEMKKCERGHYYDASVHASCPYCNRESETEKTVAMGVTLAGNAGSTGSNMMSMMERDISAFQTAESDECKTVAIFQTEQGVDPVVGWLVCMEGKEKGKDYRIHSDNNYVGRSDKMDICIKNDDTISRENQAVVTYDAGDRCFYISPGEGRSIIRLNGKAIFQTVEIHAYDRVTIGKTELLFIPLCGENFAWEE